MKLPSKIHLVILYTCLVLAVLLVLAGIIAFFVPGLTEKSHLLFFTGAALGISTFLALNLKHLKLFGADITVDRDKFTEELNKEVKEVIEKIGPKLIGIAEKGSMWIDSTQAFNDASARINLLAEEANGGVIELRILAIAMSNSWHFIDGPLLDIVKRHRGIRFKLSIAIMRSNYLSKFKLDIVNFDFAALSSTLPGKINDLKSRLKQDDMGHLSIEVFFYEGFPQWHGLLVEGRELFLGRTDWYLHTESRKPELICGANAYRYFDQSTDNGQRRINQFRHWFEFYSRYDEYSGN